MTEVTGLRTKVTLGIYGDHLDPALVSARLGLEPSRAFSREEMARKRRKPYPSTTGAWLLDSSAHVLSDELDAHLRWLLEHVSPHAEALRALAAEGLEIQVRCTLLGDALGKGQALDAPLLRDLASLGAWLVLDIYCTEESFESLSGSA